MAIDVEGKQIRTVDDLARNGALHPVQHAFCEADALMCGFCTPGFVVATVALLEKYPNATPEQARRELDGNVCRCGTFNRILEAAMKARRRRVAGVEGVNDFAGAALEEDGRASQAATAVVAQRQREAGAPVA